MTEPKKIRLPLTRAAARTLTAGERVLISGVLYAARDAAHKKIVAALQNGEALPFDLENATVYYVGPTPAPPGRVIGSAGPTTSGRMDPYTPRLIESGVTGMIGKGPRGKAVAAAMEKFGAVYFAATGGAGALLAQRITACETIAYPELGPEAVRKIEVADFPAVVAQDAHGNDIFTR